MVPKLPPGSYNITPAPSWLLRPFFANLFPAQRYFWKPIFAAFSRKHCRHIMMSYFRTIAWEFAQTRQVRDPGPYLRGRVFVRLVMIASLLEERWYRVRPRLFSLSSVCLRFNRCLE